MKTLPRIALENVLKMEIACIWGGVFNKTNCQFLIVSKSVHPNDYYCATQESPLPVDPSMFPSWPAKSELVKRPRRKNYEHSPKAPEGGASFAKLVSLAEFL